MPVKPKSTDWFKSIRDRFQGVPGAIFDYFIPPETDTDISSLMPGMAGFLPPTLRREGFKTLIKETPKELLESPGVSEVLNKYPHTAGHLEDLLPIRGETTVSGTYYPGDSGSERFMNRNTDQARREGSILLSPGSKDPAKTLRHELGHTAMDLTQDVSMDNYNLNNINFGYALNPNEIRARAIANKTTPGTQVGRPTFPQNDYMSRIESEILNTLNHPEVDSEDKVDFISALLQRTLNMPQKFFDYMDTRPDFKKTLVSTRKQIREY